MSILLSNDKEDFRHPRTSDRSKAMLMNMAENLLKNPPKIGYLTISNALQWRLQYGRIVNLEEDVEGISQIVKLKS